MRYKKFPDLLMLELVNTTQAESEKKKKSKSTSVRTGTVGKLLAKAPKDVKDRFAELSSYLENLEDDVQLKELKFYFAFKRIKNFASVEIHPQAKEIIIHIKVNPKSVKLEKGFTKDVSKLGHYGTGDLRIIVKNDDDLEKSKPLLLKSYEIS